MALALQQALGQELARVIQGNPEVPGITVRVLQALATLLSSPHGGALVMSMHRSHFLACPLMRQLCQYQVPGCGPRVGGGRQAVRALPPAGQPGCRDCSCVGLGSRFLSKKGQCPRERRQGSVPFLQ